MIMPNVAGYLSYNIVTLLLYCLSSNHVLVDKLQLNPLIFYEVLKSINFEDEILVRDNIALPVLLCYKVALEEVVKIQRS
jgi:hypothetical protein